MTQDAAQNRRGQAGFNTILFKFILLTGTSLLAM